MNRLDSGPETKLSLTTNSLVSPADLELASEIEEPLSGLVSPKTIDPVDINAISITLDPAKSSFKRDAGKKTEASGNSVFMYDNP